jgi:hypothetical protein
MAVTRYASNYWTQLQKALKQRPRIDSDELFILSLKKKRPDEAF